MKYNKNKYSSSNSKNKLTHFEYPLKERNSRRNYPPENINYLENNTEINLLQNQNIKNGGQRNLNIRVNRNIISENEPKINRNNYIKNSYNNQMNNNNQTQFQKEIFNTRSRQNILTENNYYNNKRNRNIIVNNYSPNYSHFDNILNNNNKKDYNSAIPQLNFKKLKIFPKYNTDRNNFYYDYDNENMNNNVYTDINNINNKINNNKQRNKVISTNHIYIEDDNDEEKNKTEYDNRYDNDFHNYIKMGSYFSRSNSKNKNESDIRTEKLRNRILFGEKNPKLKTLKVQGKINRLRQIPYNNYEHVDIKYYPNTVHKSTNQRNINYNNDDLLYNNYNTIDGPRKMSETLDNYNTIGRPKRMSDILDNKANITLSNLIGNSNIKDKPKKKIQYIHIDNANNNVKGDHYNQNNKINKRWYDNKIINKGNNINNYNNVNNINKNIEALIITSFNINLSSNENKNVNQIKKADDFKDGIFLIKKINGEITSKIEINNTNIQNINKYFEDENIKINNSLLELNLKNEINDIKEKYQNIQKELNLLKDCTLVYEKKNLEITLENNKLKEEKENLKNNINLLENKINELLEEKKNLEIKDKNDKTIENKNIEKDNDYKKRYKRREINYKNK